MVAVIGRSMPGNLLGMEDSLDETLTEGVTPPLGLWGGMEDSLAESLPEGVTPHPVPEHRALGPRGR